MDTTSAIVHPEPTHVIVYETPDIYTVEPTTITVTAVETLCATDLDDSKDGCQTLTPGTYSAPEHTVTITETSQTYICPYTVVEPKPTDVKHESATPEPTHVIVYETPDVYTVEPTTITVTAVETLCAKETEHSDDGCQTLTPGTYGAPEHTVTITETSQTYICPYTLVHPKPTEQPEPTSVHEPEPKPTKHFKPEHKQVTPSKPEEPKKEEKPKGSGHADIQPNGKRWAMTYTPYTRDGQCKSSGEVDTDISAIASKGFTAVRLYATDCDALENIGNACAKYSVRMIIGVFIDAAGISASGEQVEQIMSWGRWDMVEMFVIGNEAVFNGYCSAAELAGFISEVKSRARSAGYDGPCTTAETINVLEADGATICDVVDVFGANLHPFFNPEVTAEQAGSFVEKQMEIISSLCPNKEAYNLECGWPSAGNPNGAAVPGAENQKKAVFDVLERMGEKTCILSFDNDDWKDAGEFGVENHYGTINIFT